MIVCRPVVMNLLPLVLRRDRRAMSTTQPPTGVLLFFAIQRHAKRLATDLSQTRWIRHQPLAEPQTRRRNRSIPITAAARCPRFSSIRFL